MRTLMTFVMIACLLWGGGLAWFVSTFPKEPLPVSHKAEAIVVLTGGKGRIEHGLEMLASDVAPVLFISGVETRVSQERVLRENASPALRARVQQQGGEIVLDHVARSTVSNADQTTAFLQTRNIHRIRLITADYHMPRSLHEFRHAMPGLDIIPDPVFPDGFQREHWWQDDASRHLVLSEFYKYIAVVVRDAIRPSQESEEP